MRAIQIVVDEPLLDRVDRLARKGGESRSAVIRRLLAAGLRDAQIAVLVEAERRSYRRRPPTSEERAAWSALSREQQKVLERLGREERW